MAEKQSLEERLRAVEDRLEILNLIAGHPPGADSASGEYAASYWVEGGVFDRGPPFGARAMSEANSAMASPEFQQAIKQGICHFTGPPYIEIDGDTAIVTSYLQILAPNPLAEEFTLSAHGTSKGFRVHRLSVSQWDLTRTAEGWRINRRTLRSMDTPEARALLRGAADRRMAAKKRR
jgi:hypothetical protein